MEVERGEKDPGRWCPEGQLDLIRTKGVKAGRREEGEKAPSPARHSALLLVVQCWLHFLGITQVGMLLSMARGPQQLVPPRGAKQHQNELLQGTSIKYSNHSSGSSLRCDLMRVLGIFSLSW